jgi:hypothetical protein
MSSNNQLRWLVYTSIMLVYKLHSYVMFGQSQQVSVRGYRHYLVCHIILVMMFTFTYVLSPCPACALLLYRYITHTESKVYVPVLVYVYMYTAKVATTDCFNPGFND